MAVTRTLIKREEAAFYWEVEFLGEGGDHAEGGRRLSPDDVVDGKKVRDWPVGVFSVNHLQLASQEDQNVET